MHNGPTSHPDQSGIIKILQAIAHEQSALGKLAGAESRKIRSLIANLEQRGTGLIPRDRPDCAAGFDAVMRAALNMHILLQTKSHMIAQHLGLPYSPAVRTAPGGDGHLLCCGEGPVTAPQDAFAGGEAVLEDVLIHMRGSVITAGRITYLARHGAARQVLRALPGTLSVEWPDSDGIAPSPCHSARICISGRGVSKKKTGAPARSGTMPTSASPSGTWGGEIAIINSASP